MTRTRLVVLANSWKHSDWCIAGIDLDTGAWVRPVTTLPDGRVPKSAMKLNGYFPKLLDIIELPLAPTGPDYGFEKENKTILPGQWLHHGRMCPADLQPYAKSTEDCILHNDESLVSLEVLQGKPLKDRYSLQLIHACDFKARASIKRTNGETTWQGIFTSKGTCFSTRITDPMFIGKTTAGYRPIPNCLLTMSLSMPYKPPEWDEEKAPACWKLIAGVIELAET